MAIKTITPVKMTRNSAIAFTYEAADSTVDGFEVPFSVKDDKALLLITSTESADTKTLTIKAGNGFQGGNDLVIDVVALSTMVLPMDSGLFKQISGDYKGNIQAIPETVKVKCQLVYAD